MSPLRRPRGRRHEPRALEVRRRKALARHIGGTALAAMLMGGVAWAVLSAAPSVVDGSPAYSRRTPEVQAAYAFAHSDDGESLQWIPCYCGCGTHSGHDSNRACFVKPDGVSYDVHGSQCDVCVDIALRVQKGLAAGQSLQDIRASVDAAYSGFTPTNTPMPP